MPRLGQFKAHNVTPDYTADELEFMLAMESYRRERRRPFPTCCEVLEVLRALGYRKDALAIPADPG